ncbi:MAG: DNA polymerase III subunit delta' [Xanthobacteraceae bacterium]
MSASAPAEPSNAIAHPRATTVLLGHDAAEQVLLGAYRAGRMPHAWLITGPAGIGKATLAYRLARFVLAHPEPGAAEVAAARSLAIATEHAVARRIVAQAQGDLLVLERRLNEKTGKLYQDIAVDDVRRTVTFFGATAGEGGWRIAIVDAVDELNAAGANALLKIVEEPPQRSLLLLVAHSPAQVLPTIRSRCRLLALRALNPPDVARAAAAALGRDPDEPAIAAAAAAADGSVARAIALCGGPILTVRERVIGLLDKMPKTDPRGLHALGDLLERAEREAFSTFVETVQEWLSSQLHRPPQDVRRLAPLAEAWSRIDEAARDVDTYNLDRRPFVFSVFRWLAEAVPG